VNECHKVMANHPTKFKKGVKGCKGDVKSFFSPDLSFYNPVTVTSAPFI